MLKSPYLFAVSVLVALLSWMALAEPLKAESLKTQETLALNFDLSPAGAQSVEPSVPVPAAAVDQTADQIDAKPVDNQPAIKNNSLPVPAAPIPISTSNPDFDKLTYSSPPLPPISNESIESQSSKAKPVQSTVSTATDSTPEDIGLSFAIARTVSAERPENEPKPASPETIASAAETGEARLGAAEPTASVTDDVTLSFESTGLETALESLQIETAPGEFSGIEPSEVGASEIEANTDQVSLEAFGLDDWIFRDGSDSLVARTVGSAEGTRHWQGDRTLAYYGHVDPGNGVWNLGTFSYQHGASSPEEADEKQLRRLKRQGVQLKAQAESLGIQLSLEEKLNALDLANQAPLAALDRGGYIERLAQARRLNMEGDKAILWARTYAYLDPDTRAWNAPGLGNNIYSISKDQERRIDAIAKALKAFNPSEEKNKSLDNLQQISLEGSVSETPFGDRVSSDLSSLAATFELPPNVASSSPPSSTTATVEPNEGSAAVSAELSSTNLSSADITSPIQTAPIQTAPIQTAPTQTVQSAEQLSEGDELGVAFSPTEALTAIDDTAEVSTAEANIFDLHTRRNTTTNDANVENQATAPEAKLEASVEPQTIALTQETAAAEAEENRSVANNNSPQARLKELIAGVIPRNENSVDTADATDTADSEAATEATEAKTVEERPLWRVEDKILPQK